MNFERKLKKQALIIEFLRTKGDFMMLQKVKLSFTCVIINKTNAVVYVKDHYVSARTC